MEKRERLFKLLKWGGAVLGMVLMIFWTSGAFHSKISAGKVDVAPGVQLPADAALFTVEVTDVSPRIDVVGTVASEEKVNLSARISAYIKEVFVSAGNSVKKDQVLIQLDDREFQEQLRAAKAQLKQANSEYKRTRGLFAKKATTEQALIAAESMQRSAQAQVDRMKIMLTYAKIISPIDGVVTERRVEVGDLANPGQLLLAVYDPENMRIEVPVPVRLIEKLSLGQEVDIELDRPSMPLTGAVTEIVAEIDPLSRTQKVKVHINSSGVSILPGTFGRVWVLGDPRPAVLVPASAVYNVGQLNIVQVASDQRVLRRMVKTGPMHNQQIEILSGLKQGDKILVTPVKEGI